MALLGPRLEDPDVYAAVVVRMCDAIAFSGGEGSGDGIKDEQLSAATRRRQLVLVQEVR